MLIIKFELAAAIIWKIALSAVELVLSKSEERLSPSIFSAKPAKCSS
jgi:hypothetical protein